MKTRYKTHLKIVLFVLLFFGVSGKFKASAAVCYEGECEPDKYVCGSGWMTYDMCCTGGGCPSWVCNQNEWLEWSPWPPQCCYVVPAKWIPPVTTWREVKECTRVCEASAYVGSGCSSHQHCDLVWKCNYNPYTGLICGYVLECYSHKHGPCDWICFAWGEDCVWVWKSSTVPGYWTVPYTDCRNAIPPDPNDTCSWCTGILPNGNGGEGEWGPWSECTEPCDGGTQSRTHTDGSIETRACNTDPCEVTTTNIRGFIWNATGKSCTSNPDAGLEIVKGSSAGNVSEDITVTLDGIKEGDWDPGTFGGYSYEFADEEKGDHIITASVSNPVGYPNSKYRLACVNDQEIGVAAVNAQADPTTVHLGYKITSIGWFQLIDGDVFGSCNECPNSVSMSLPTAGELLGGFKGYLVSGGGTVFGDSGLSVADPFSSDKFSENDNRHLKYMASESPWPEGFSFTPPSLATEITNCSDVFSGGFLSGGSVYTGSVSCIQDGLDNLGAGSSYSLSDSGVAVIHVTGTDTLEFDKDFKASDSAKRILFITQGNVRFGKDIGAVAPTSATDAHIQASIISEKSIRFESGGGRRYNNNC